VKVFLADASGAIARRIIPQLVRRDHHVTVATRTTSRCTGCAQPQSHIPQRLSGYLRAQIYARMSSGRSAATRCAQLRHAPAFCGYSLLLA
jgi:hypothetical protein